MGTQREAPSARQPPPCWHPELRRRPPELAESTFLEVGRSRWHSVTGRQLTGRHAGSKERAREWGAGAGLAKPGRGRPPQSVCFRRTVRVSLRLWTVCVWTVRVTACASVAVDSACVDSACDCVCLRLRLVLFQAAGGQRGAGMRVLSWHEAPESSPHAEPWPRPRAEGCMGKRPGAQGLG